MVRQAREQVAQEVEAAKSSLVSQSELLADQIAEAMLRRSAA
jgi:F0F1-type ATP synthase membrane subunit b/b'